VALPGDQIPLFAGTSFKNLDKWVGGMANTPFASLEINRISTSTGFQVKIQSETGEMNS